MTQRRRYSGQFKARVAIEAIRGDKTINELVSEHGVHANQIMRWKKQVLEELQGISRRAGAEQEEEELKASLYQQIGQLKVELDWLKKKLDWLVERKRAGIEPESEQLSVARQCQLLGLARSSYYYRAASDSQENVELMPRIDEQYTQTPFYGSRRMTVWLRAQGVEVNRKRVQRLMRRMGIEAVYPKPRLSQAGAGHRLYSYLLRGLTIDRPRQVWCSDITYIRLRMGFSIWWPFWTGTAAM